MAIRTFCGNCKDEFYGTEDDSIAGVKFCSYCLPYMRTCLVCGCGYYKKKPTKSGDYGICKECRDKNLGGIGNYSNIYLILRFMTFKKDNFTCRYCGRSPLKDKSVVLHCDHIIPRNNGGEDKMENLVTACAECNSGKLCTMLDKGMINKINERKIFYEEPN